MAAISPSARDRKTVFKILGIIFLVALVIVIFGPRAEDSDPDPTTYNTGTQGAKAAYLLLSELGYTSQRWEQPTADLHNADAAHSTLILTNPKLPVKDKELKPLRDAVADFLNRGGWVVATGISGAQLLPGGATAQPSEFHNGLCYTVPDGDGALANAGKVPLYEASRWSAGGSQFHIEQRCGNDGVVVRYAVGKGEAIWWSSAMPLTNAGLAGDPSLKLFLASIGPPGRTVLFDEYLHTSRESVVDLLGGLPWWSFACQLAVIGLLLVFSFSRRNGPLRMPVYIPRTSPIEFAESMGRLYKKAGATHAATEAARGRVIDALREQCGIPRELLALQAPRVAQELAGRFGGDWSELDRHLEQSHSIAVIDLAPKSALRLVQALDGDFRRLQGLMRARTTVTVVNR